MIPKDYKYYDRTKEGYQIVARYQDRTGYLHIVAKRTTDYIIGHHYDPTTGYWGEGSYMYETKTEAERVLLKGDDGPFTSFDPENESDVRFEYDAQYNWNHVDKKYLRENDHRSARFDTRPHSNFGWQRKGTYFGDGKEYPDTEMGYEEFKRAYRKRNAPQRSMSIQRGVRR